LTKANSPLPLAFISSLAVTLTEWRITVFQPHLRIRLLASLLALIILSLMPSAIAQKDPYTVDTLTFDAMGNEP
jgi:hypothetical protein